MAPTSATSSASSAASTVGVRDRAALITRTLAPFGTRAASTTGVRVRPPIGPVRRADPGEPRVAWRRDTDYPPAVAGPSPSPAALAALADAVREAASTRVWSQGVTLCRDDRVSGKDGGAGEVVLEVRLPGRPVPLTVVLYPDDEEWDCDCGGREAACSHVVAAVLATQQALASGADRPTSRRAGATVRYRLRPAGGGLALSRLAVDAAGAETRLDAPIASIVAGRAPCPTLATTETDLTVDQLVGTRLDAAFGADRVERLIIALADAPDVWLDDARVRCAAEPVLPRARVVDDGPDVVLRLTAPPGVTALCHGVARDGDVLRPVGAQDLSGPRLEHLPAELRFGPDRLAALVTRVLPELTRRLDVDVRSRRLPEVSRGDAPRIALDVVQRGDTVSVLATLVYGDPPRARIDGDRLVHLGGAVPTRDPAAEQALRHRLRGELDLLPGRRVEARGPDAFTLSNKIARWLRDDARAAALAHAVDLAPEVALDRGLVASFRGEGRSADAAAVVRAWQAGADLVALDGGGWGRLPMAWLDRHGALLADLLAAADGETLPPYALPDAARLARELDVPAPDLSRLAPLVDGFTGLPPAPLAPELAAVLRPYQRAGVDWLVFARDAQMGCVLADDMGLGKTLQALCAARGRALVVCPTSVAPNWLAEARRFRPELACALYHGPRRALDPAAELTVTTYPILRNDIDRLAEVPWDTVILDEAQAIKNPDSQLARAAYRLRGGWRLALSGTPVENRLDELWSQLHFTNPGLMGSRVEFAARWAAPIEGGDRAAAERLRARIRPFVLRRLKREVAPELPPRTEAVLWVELDEPERAAYDAIRAATQAELVAVLARGGGVMAALEALLRLRQAACHRGLLPGQEAATSTKVATVIEALTAAAADGHKALVFSQWTSLLDRVEPALADAGLPFTRLDGSTADRAGVVAAFQDPAGPPVMLVSLKAGGTGLNLTAADHVFLLDPWWNPAVEDQAADRAHRIGQDRPVMIYRVVARDTVEERVLALQEHKRRVAAAALDGADAAARLTRDDLLALLAD
ncbi:MAG: DEAD/DEAH box helicase [Kofleriaceae bacterium]|nr:DEAD/DEAH box helicase [Kofleriaceae bacterium]